MKISDIKIRDVVEYLHLEKDEYTDTQMDAIMKAAQKVISDYTGLPLKSGSSETDSVDRHEDFYIPFMILCQDMYDNRTLVVDKDTINPTVKLILGLHDENLVG